MADDLRSLITPEGLARFQEELRRLQEERHEVCAVVAWAAGNGDRSENGDYIYNKQRLRQRSEEHTSELQSLMRISYAVFCLTKKIRQRHVQTPIQTSPTSPDNT